MTPSKKKKKIKKVRSTIIVFSGNRFVFEPTLETAVLEKQRSKLDWNNISDLVIKIGTKVFVYNLIAIDSFDDNDSVYKAIEEYAETGEWSFDDEEDDIQQVDEEEIQED